VAGWLEGRQYICRQRRSASFSHSSNSGVYTYRLCAGRHDLSELVE
jgi:hypothetical protein